MLQQTLLMRTFIYDIINALACSNINAEKALLDQDRVNMARAEQRNTLASRDVVLFDDYERIQ